MKTLRKDVEVGELYCTSVTGPGSEWHIFKRMPPASHTSECEGEEASCPCMDEHWGMARGVIQAGYIVRAVNAIARLGKEFLESTRVY